AEVARTLEGLRRGDYAWAVFSSANAVEVYLDLLRDAGGDARAFAGARICAIGKATARALDERGLRADLVPSEAIGEAVVAAIRDAAGGTLDGASVLLPHAEGARDVIRAGLE